MPFVRIWIHLIWATKNRRPILTRAIRLQVFTHIRENAKSKGIHLDFINGCSDHIHLLVSMNQEQTISKIVHLLKGESSHWINENKLSKVKFNWQEEYIAVSVNHSDINRVREYIKNQEEHHRIKSFTEENKLFLERNGL
ncbi:IS200/IS605 family transposase [Candidatus Cloacimonadota bacterium]